MRKLAFVVLMLPVIALSGCLFAVNASTEWRTALTMENHWRYLNISINHDYLGISPARDAAFNGVVLTYEILDITRQPLVRTVELSAGGFGVTEPCFHSVPIIIGISGEVVS